MSESRLERRIGKLNGIFEMTWNIKCGVRVGDKNVPPPKSRHSAVAGGGIVAGTFGNSEPFSK